MKTIELKPLSASDGRDIYDMLQEIPADENGYVNSVCGMSYEEYKAWLIREEKNAKKTELEDGWKVPQSTYWLYADGRPVGQGRIRHFLTDALREAGGNIGYVIRPTARGRGNGTILLRELRKEAAKLGIERALVTVHNDNPASIRVAMKNGGALEKVTDTRHLIWVDCRKEKKYDNPLPYAK
jgi:predicted acetyltransferase